VLAYYVIAKKDFNPTAEIPITSLPVWLSSIAYIILATFPGVAYFKALPASDFSAIFLGLSVV
jgi:hypothetical protein